MEGFAKLLGNHVEAASAPDETPEGVYGDLLSAKVGPLATAITATGPQERRVARGLLLPLRQLWIEQSNATSVPQIMMIDLAMVRLLRLYQLTDLESSLSTMVSDFDDHTDLALALLAQVKRLLSEDTVMLERLVALTATAPGRPVPMKVSLVEGEVRVGEKRATP